MRVLAIVGPTASGKSALAISLARRYKGEVISADSRQVYTGLDIGTGKVTKREMAGIPHHLLDIASPRRVFTAKDFVLRATRAAKEIENRGKIPILCGGTGFYIDALLGRIAIPDALPDKTLRARLAKKSVKDLFEMLQKKDPDRAARMNDSDKQNPRRLMRAIEVVTRGSIATVTPLEADVLWIGLRPDWKVLEKKIYIRLTARLRQGMLAEAKHLHTRGLSYKRMRALGLEYRSLADHLEGIISRVELEEILRREIRRYAKKQLSYFARNTAIQWFDPKQKSSVERVVRNWLPKR